MGKWSHLKRQTKTVTLPDSRAEVVIRKPDIVSSLLTSEVSLPDSLFAVFAKSTEEGQSDVDALQDLQRDGEASQGLLDFLNLLAKASLVEPTLVDTEEEADYETKVWISDISMIDKMFVMQQFPGMFDQLAGLQTFRPEANGAIQPASESDGLPAETE